jgi:predicted metal-dependent peptidase
MILINFMEANLKTITSSEKVANGKATLLRKQPFFGVTSFKLIWKENNSIPTACTDGKSILWNGSFFDGLTKSQAIGVILHEMFHVILKHPIQMKRFLKKNPQYNTPYYLGKANEAMDYAINPKIKAIQGDWVSLPDNCLYKEEYVGMHWIDIFFDLIKNDQPEDQPEDGNGDQGDDQGDDDNQSDDQSSDDSQGDGDSQDQDTTGSDKPSDQSEDGKGQGGDNPSNQPNDAEGGMGGVMCPTNEDGTDMSQSQLDEMEKELDVLIEQAINIEKARNKGNTDSHLIEIAENNKKSKVNWEMVLRRFIAPIKPKHQSFNRLNRKYQANGINMPYVKKGGTSELALAIDTSASTEIHEIKQCIAEVQKIVDKIQPEKVTIHWFTSTVWQTDVFKTGQKLAIPQNLRRGGTSFQAVFDKVNSQPKKPKALIVLTDMGDYFPKKPSYPVLWVSTQPNKTAPFGKVVHLDAVA